MFRSGQNSTQAQRILRDCLQALMHFSIRNPQRSRPLPQRMIAEVQMTARSVFGANLPVTEGLQLHRGLHAWFAHKNPPATYARQAETSRGPRGAYVQAAKHYREFIETYRCLPAHTNGEASSASPRASPNGEMFARRSATDASQAMIAPPFKSTEQTSSAESAGPNNSVSVPLPEM
jgi:hypothetical protein